MPSESFTFATFMWIAVGYCNVLLLCTVTPFLLSYAVEGVVIARGRGDVRPLTFALFGAFAAIMGCGAIWHVAASTPGVPESFEAGMLTAASYVLPIAIAVSVLVYAAPRVRDQVIAATASPVDGPRPRVALRSSRRDDAGSRVLVGSR